MQARTEPSKLLRAPEEQACAGPHHLRKAKGGAAPRIACPGGDKLVDSSPHAAATEVDHATFFTLRSQHLVVLFLYCIHSTDQQ